MDTNTLFPLALRHGVEFLPASLFYATTNYLRLAYSYSDADAIAEEIRRLGAAVAEFASP